MPRLLITGCSSGFARELFEIRSLGTLAMTQAVMPAMRQRRNGVIVTSALDVADAVWRAVTDVDAPMLLPAAADAEALFRNEDRFAA